MGWKLIPPIWFVIALGAMTLLNLTQPGPRWLEFPWRYAGLVPLAIGLGLFVGSVLIFKRAQTTIRPGLKPTALVTSGPFRLSRNPIYLGMTLALIAAGVLMGTLTPLFVVPIFALIIDRLFITMEERVMEETLGEAYREYKGRVRRWV